MLGVVGEEEEGIEEGEVVVLRTVVVVVPEVALEVELEEI